MIYLAGDINLTDGFFDTGFGVGTSLTKGNDPYMHLNRSDNDVWIGNFEGVCANFSDKEGIYKRQFLIAPQYLARVKHFDYYGVANNHVMQHGKEAYREMLQNLVGLGCGIFGDNIQRSVTFEHQSKKVSVLAFSERPENFSKEPLYWYCPEYLEIQKEYQKISDSDFKIAYIHWGNEFIDRPYEEQKRFARWLVDLGFDLIVGMHPHLLQGFECYKDKYIFYSIGNFVFNMAWEPLRYSCVVNVDLGKSEPLISYRYIHIGEDFFPKQVEICQVPEKYRFEYLNSLLRDGVANEIYYNMVFQRMKKYRRNNWKNFIGNIGRFKSQDIQAIVRDFVYRRIKK
ncbi:CapA family protein [Butyricimonas synergistica]|uniref:CapA family protein n=1 Tax=Butyricimonas synergistica TaxID=544644 RepID=UPI0022E4E978|nr:CapA family protein [Butyricimonas synergistica]